MTHALAAALISMSIKVALSCVRGLKINKGHMKLRRIHGGDRGKFVEDGNWG